MTQILEARSSQALELAARLLDQGEIIALPTDTIYGVGAVAFNAQAVAKIYQIKERPSHKAIPVFVKSLAELERVCRDVPSAALPLLEEYWPGGLTVILSAAPTLPGIVTNYGPTVAVRIPDHPVVLDLLALVDQPLAVTSANVSGQPTPPTAAEIEAQLGKRLPLILDDGPSPGGVASTILDLTQAPPKILRQGAAQIPLRRLQGL